MPHLRRADDLLTGHDDLAPHGGGETGGRIIGWTDGWMGSEERGHPEPPQRRRQPLVNRAIALAQCAEGENRRGDGVGQFLVVPDGAAAGGAAHQVEAAALDFRTIVAGQGRLVPSEREARRVPPVQPQKRGAGPIRFMQQRLVDRHVLGPGVADAVDKELPVYCTGSRCWEGA